MDKFGVSTLEELQLCRAFIDASVITSAGFEKLDNLSKEAVNKILTTRYMNTASGIVDSSIHNIEASIRQKFVVDMKIINHLISKGYDFNSALFDTGLMAGEENITNGLGLLDAYEKAFISSKSNPSLFTFDRNEHSIAFVNNESTGKPYKAIELLKEMKEKMKNKKEDINESRSL